VSKKRLRGNGAGTVYARKNKEGGVHPFHRTSTEVNFS
jgi:hypothetical protein